MFTRCTEANWNDENKPWQEAEQKGSQGNWQVQEGGRNTEQEIKQEQQQQQKGEKELAKEEKHDQ